MTTEADIVNRALQVIGTRTTVTAGELAAGSSNEAKQANLILTKFRDQLLRMAPWNCGIKYGNLWYLTSTPGSPENSSPATNLWQPGQPAPPWNYEYLYPPDCLRACFLVPGMLTGIGGVPIYPGPVGPAPQFWAGPPAKFNVTLDDYLREVTASTLTAAGTGHAINDIVTLGGIPQVQGAIPAGLVQIKVLSLGASGAIATYSIYASEGSERTGFCFSVPSYPLQQIATSGFGINASITVTTLSATMKPARVVLTNQEYATLAWVRRVTDPNVMDEDFIEAWVEVLGGALAIPLTGDKILANMRIKLANEKIKAARESDANEGLRVNDVMPDWMQIRGVGSAGGFDSPWSSFDWGGTWPSFA